MGLQSLAAAVALAIPVAAFAGDLQEMARAAEEQARLTAPLRADISAEIDGTEGKKQERIVMLFRPAPKGKGVELYVQLETAALRYLILPQAAHAAEKGKVKTVTLDTPIDGTSWTIEDLLPFSIERCGMPRTVEVMPDYMTILCDLKTEHRKQYVLQVYKFDREKAVPSRVLFYQERQDNLVKILRNEEFELVGRKWRPSRAVMQNFKLKTRDVFELKWSQDPRFPPEAFDPAGFASAEIPAAQATASAPRP